MDRSWGHGPGRARKKAPRNCLLGAWFRADCKPGASMQVEAMVAIDGSFWKDDRTRSHRTRSQASSSASVYCVTEQITEPLRDRVLSDMWKG